MLQLLSIYCLLSSKPERIYKMIMWAVKKFQSINVIENLVIGLKFSLNKGVPRI